MTTDLDLAKRVWTKVAKRGADECWAWTGGIFRASGYGRVQLPNKRGTTAHRVVWTLLYGEPHADLEICHTCDNRVCCNPAHLFAGTPKVNALDKMRKGRVARLPGTKNGSCKLSEADIAAIRASAESHRGMARRYGVSEGNIRMIRSRETWRHV